jgi:molybdopterin/thiamine biosynthesis adenylyltransferase
MSHRDHRGVEIRIPAHLLGPLLEGIAWTKTREAVIFGLVTHTELKSRTVLLLRDLIALPAAAYIPMTGHGAAWSGAAMLPVMNAAIGAKCGIVAFHSHPHAGPVSLSGDDLQSAARLLPAFEQLIPSRPHGSVVLGSSHVAGLVAVPGEPDLVPKVRMRLLGQQISDMPSSEWPGPVYRMDGTFARQALLTGEQGEAKIREARVAVVGLSGGGSHVVQQLAHMGIGEIIGIDAGRAKLSHRARVIGLTRLDAIRRRRKTAIMHRLVRNISRKVTFTGITHMIPGQPAINALKEADVVVGCVDSYHVRADLQDLCARFLIPYVDIGLLIRPVESGEGVTIGGNVITSIPGRFCLWCIEFLDQEKLDAETNSRSRSYFEGADGQAQVISMNGVLASAAVSEILGLITGFAPAGGEPTIKKYDGLRGTLQEWVVKPRRPCPACVNNLGTGEIIWRAG